MNQIYFNAIYLENFTKETLLAPSKMRLILVAYRIRNEQVAPFLLPARINR